MSMSKRLFEKEQEATAYLEDYAQLDADYQYEEYLFAKECLNEEIDKQCEELRNEWNRKII